MSIKTQGIAPLGQSVQQHNDAALAAIKADQAKTLTESDTQNLEFQRHVADTSGGSITITLKPAADWPKYVPYFFQKVAAGNTMTIDAAGSETIEGNATIAVTGNYTVIAIYSDGTALRRYTEGGTAAGAAGALLAANNLSDLAAVATARTNLGGTATGVALFTAANAAAAATAVGATVTGAALLTAASAAAARSTLGVGTHYIGPFDFNVDNDSALGSIKFAAPFAGTITTVRGALYGTGPTDQAITIDMAINGVAVTGGGVTFNAGAADGATQSSPATAANVLAAGDLVAIGVTTTNTANMRGTFSFEYTLA